MRNGEKLCGHFIKKRQLCSVWQRLLTGCAKEGEVQDTEKKQEDTVLTILVQQSGTNMSGTWEGESADRLYEETGIRLEFYSNGNGDENG